MATRTLLLARHGKYARGPHGEALTPLGKKQAAALGRHLTGARVDAIWSSTMPRAVETAAIVRDRAFPRKKVRRCSDLCECLPGLAPALRERLDISSATARDGRRHAERAYRRFFRRARSRSTTELLVCHGNLIRYLVVRAIGVRDTTVWTRLAVHNGSLSAVDIDARGQARLVFYNGRDFMPRKAWTE
jgi:serine/threonine-protein phosphatase PGAM5